MAIKETRHNRDVQGAARRSLNNFGNFLVLQSNDIFPINFEQIVLRKESVSRCRRVLNNVDDFSVTELESDATRRISDETD